MLIPSIIIDYITSRMLFTPVVALMEQIKGMNLGNLPARFSQKHANNELGMLTQTVETTMNQINAFIQREKQFTRNASHELRTPLTIVKGAKSQGFGLGLSIVSRLCRRFGWQLAIESEPEKGTRTRIMWQGA